MALVEASAGTLFAIFYLLFSAGFVLQFREFVGAGLSPENILTTIGFLCCGEDVRFLEFHLAKTAGALVLHSLMPLGFIVGYGYFTICVDEYYADLAEFLGRIPCMQPALTVSIMLPISAAALAYYWYHDNWSKHPFVAKIAPYATNGLWRNVAGDINTEFRRIDKFTIHTTPLTKVVVTDNWLILVGQWPWSFHLAHQSDVTLSLIDSDHHQIAPDGQAGGTQFLTIEVKNGRRNSESFRFRLNALEYQNLTDKAQGSIFNVRNIQIYKTVSERFVEVFREEARLNPPAPARAGEAELEACIGCMVATANVRLVRRCLGASEEGAAAAEPAAAAGEGTSEPCVNCYCRPMWCLDCLGKWFASRQNQQEPETWLSSKCPCPTCRSKFCILDVAIINTAA